ncbi:MAG: hypothetical protein NC548_27405 [Lachnospiraceae bacterium]|nr:hypothetical protein [Lachnospiraceae bacterium]
MKTNKLHITILLAICVSLSVVVLLLCGFTTKTANAETGEETAVVALLSDEAENETAEGEETAPAVPETLWTRIEQWFSNNLAEFLGSVNLGAVAACIVAVIVEHRGNKKAAKITADSLGINTNSNSDVVKAVNTLIEGYNETLDKLHAMETKAEQQEHIIATLETSSKAILEILATVYANNKNIPQAVKDLVNIKYVQALKAELPLPVETEDKGSTEEG